MERNLQKLKNAITDTKDVHQSILDIGYEEWRDPKYSTMSSPHFNMMTSYEHMVNWMEKEFGKIAKLAILIGKYNQQVCNGGHQQYFDNGYADGIGGCFDEHSSYPLHKELTQLVETHLVIPHKEELLEILKYFKLEIALCDECGGGGYIWCEGECDDDGEQIEDDYEEDCWNCDGTGEDTRYKIVYRSEELDSSYFKISEVIMKEVEEFLKNKLEII